MPKRTLHSDAGGVSRRHLIAGAGAAAGAVALTRAGAADAQIPAVAASWVIKALPTGGCLLDGAGVAPVTYSDPAQALQTALNDLAPTGGTIRVERGQYEWRSVPRIPRNAPRALRIVGEGGTLVKLSSTAPRFLDLDCTADHQTFRNIEIGHFKIDAGGVSGIHAHVIVGIDDVRVNFEDIYIHDVLAYNIPVVQGSNFFRSGIRLTAKHLAAHEDAQNYMRGIRCERVRVRGGNVAIEIAGRCTDTVSNAGGINVFVDDIVYNDCSHDTGIVPTTGPWGSSFQIGGRAHGGRCRVINCYSKGSGDTGIEVNGMRDGLVDGCTVEDARGNAFYMANMMNPLGPGRTAESSQRVTWRDCTVIRNTGTQGHGFRVGYNTVRVPLGTAVIENCKYIRTTPELNRQGEVAFFNAPMVGARIDGLQVQITNIAYNEAAATTASLIGTNNQGNHPRWFIARDIDVTVRGRRVAGPAPFDVFQISGACSFAVSDVSFFISLDNWAINWVTLFALGIRSGSKLRGSIERVDGTFDVDNGRFVCVYGAATLTIPGKIRLSKLAAQGAAARADVYFQDATNRPRVTMSEIDWVNNPGVSVVQPTSSPYVLRNTDGPACAVTVGGAGVTKIEVSSDGVSFVPTGMTQGGLVIPNGAALRVTYSGSAPTITKLPL